MGVPEERFTTLQTHAAFAADTIGKIIAIGIWIVDQPDGAQRTLSRYGRVLEWLAPLADGAGAPGLSRACERLLAHLADLALRESGLAEPERALLRAWPGLLLDYLAAPADREAARALVEYLCDPAWPRPLTPQAAAELESTLRLPSGGYSELAPLPAKECGDAARAAADPSGCPASDERPLQARPAPGSDAVGDTGGEAFLLPQAEAPGSADVLAAIAALQVAEGPEPVVDGLEVLAAQADVCGLSGLVDVCLRLAEGAAALAGKPAEARPWLGAFAAFPAAAQAYVSAPHVAAAGEALVSLLAHPALQLALTEEDLDLLRLLLQPADGGGGGAAEASCTTEVEPEVEPEVPMQQADPAMLALFRDELDGVFAAAHEALHGALHGQAAERTAGLAAYAEEMERLAAGAEAVGLAALGEVLREFPRRLSSASGSAAPDAASGQRLASLGQRLRDYLAAPTDADNAAAILELLDSGLPTCAGRVAALTAVELRATDPFEAPARETVAQPQDVSLALPEDINQELLDGLLGELPIQTTAFTEAVQRIAAGRGGLKDIDDAKRAAHTLKGAANTVGVRGIANLTHHLEDILIVLAEHAVLPNLGLSQTLGYAADCLEGMSDALSGSGETPEDALNVLQDVLNWSNRIARDGAGVAAGEAAGAVSSPETEDGARKPGTPDQDAMLRVPAHLIDELLRLVGETMTATAQIQNRLDQTVERARSLGRQNAMFRQLVGDMEKLVDLRGVALPHQSHAQGEFDALEFEQYSELQTVTRRLIEVATDSHELGVATEEQLTALHELVGLQGRLQAEQQGVAMRTRMVPVRSVASRLQRGVRQACRLLDKEVELEIQGADTPIDGNVLGALVDPLMHLLRNGVDHGIEAAEQRRLAGKPAAGHIQLSFKREGDHITVRCRDDGAGLDLAAIRRVAERKGLVDRAASLTDDQLRRLILVPGFSTRDEATQVSGRGIGLDAVNAKVMELKGTLKLDSEPGRGLTVEVRLPTSLLSAHALLVRAREHLLAVSTRGIEDIVYVAADRLETLGNQLVYRHGDRLVDVMRFESLLNLPPDRREAERKGRPMLLARLDSGAYCGVMVQELLQSRHVTVKPLGRYVGKVGGVIGATILGDGSVAPVLDLQELLRALEREQGASAAHGLPLAGRPQTTVVGRPHAERQVLIVDDSVSARRTTAQIVRDAGFEVRTAIDGLEAVAILERMVPDVIITDMEMPRMNGLELTSHVRARQSTRDVPVVMITSRSTEKHRRQAEASGVNAYLTKPFGAEELVQRIGMLMR